MAPATKRTKTETKSEEHAAVTLFREYVRIKTVQPKPDYKSCTAFLKRQAKELDLPFYVYEMVKGKPICIMTWAGTEPDAPAILLNSHTDVVPVFPESWKYDPFEAFKDENGDIYGRGTQDMKSVGIQHLEAVRRLKAEGKRFKRTLHLCFIADEELGGIDGMEKFVKSDDFKKLNIGFALDEGLASPDDTVPVYYGERNVFWAWFRCPGNPGHGSQFIPNTAGEKMQFIINKLMGLREEQKKLFESHPEYNLGDVTTVNLTMVSGGVQHNVVPNELKVAFDIRLTPRSDVKAFEKQLFDWAREAGEGVELTFSQKFTDQTLTSVSPDDAWFNSFKKATDKHNLKIETRIFPAGTDSRYLREVGIPALGFSPMNNTPVLLHDHNEFLNEKIFLTGIDIFCDVISEVANV